MTPDYPTARSRAARCAALVMEAFEMIILSEFSREQAQHLVRKCFFDMVERVEARGGYVPTSRQPDMEIDEQDILSRRRVRALKQQLLNRAFDGFVSEFANDTLASHGLQLDALPGPRQLDVLSGIARVQVEEQRLFQLRLTDQLASFSPADSFFDCEPAPPRAVVPAANLPQGLSVADAIDRYLAFGRLQWVPKTYEARVWQLRFFREHVGATSPLVSVTDEHIRTFREGVRALHKRHGKMKGASFQERQTANPAYRIGEKTASITFEPIKAFFRWAKSVEGLIAINPASDVRIVTAKKPKGQKSRRNFTADELRKLFTQPIFLGCRSVHRRYEPGPHVIRDAKFWIPVLGYYSGTRLGELVQLHVRDVHLDGPVPFISIDEENGPNVAAGDRKHVKSEAGVRRVPLHPDVLELGFAKFVTGRAKYIGKGRVRLFDEFAYGSDRQASTVASKWFARFMDSADLRDPKLVFHSFRHNAEDAFRDALIPKYLIDRLIGHSDQSASAAYGEGPSLEVMHDAVKAMRLKVRLPDLFSER